MSSEYKATIGLEIHAELKTETKMFCNSKNDPDEKKPNANICPVCMGHPGTLPVINKEAVKSVLKVGLALQGNLADYTEFDRKNYFYPDIPKGYQISQYKYPLVSGGELNGVKLTRIHLEEDTALSKHKGNYSLIDFNRAGVPLMELVTEPVITSAKQAAAFAKELQLTLRYMNVADANMEKGEMRVEANVSVSKDSKLGTKTEIKNLNSFKIAEKAIEYEIERQTGILEAGEKVVQETRGWDENKQETFSQRQKEGSSDYRYFPDPDLPKLKLSEIKEFGSIGLANEIPDLPSEKRELYRETGIKAEDVEVFVQSPFLGELFLSAVKAGASPPITANYITSDLIGLMGGNIKEQKFKFSIKSFFELLRMLSKGEIGSRAGKDILKIMYEEGGAPKSIAKEKGLYQQNDMTELRALAEKIISENDSVINDYKSGQGSALQFLIGQAMKETKGSANPQVISEIFTDLLK
ncbi:MAG TPA: Asp-tRNA(Asn)/Glu-tRNA(Gln) amidotransferase subunit GatB [Candidatus Paceibacterota bacterium]|jgi:aspartyl-tRNA(Asn)/glutamyl-tRNA(Gln) amidotransferase subunit B|nr:Asp-tRNA(Asn)/Glu-tRNA(Gln) amidotransferase GatCAB subunit B [Parcubacteria group bacterium]MDP6119729.1 Asp-tRNA(Asn)/Glu-tRNA(Gln) amidotransferase subunit GatB [Candidatus Paceibacterota bacterium]HJN62948.1 Asp-tRNA(Asn)/Glu-tRNA(Gln) amidotransferase subunit GatB [Candidatus Paceibacterota bacterium]|tara:strand:- start:11721 stop:13124 length:1404 start_codon:yes stop_codon:yes gene_type:complete